MNTDQLKTEEIIANSLNELRITDSKIRQNALTIVKNMNIEYSDSNDYWIFIMKVIISRASLIIIHFRNLNFVTY